MYKISEVPFPLTATPEGSEEAWGYQNGILSAKALAKSDLYRNPVGDYEIDANASLNASRLLGKPEDSDFQLSAKVSVEFQGDYDAGVLCIWESASVWAKLCFEYSPDKEFMVVSVVTQGSSDDVNSFTVNEPIVWLRVSRGGHLYAFHASTDGNVWKLVRAFTLGKNTSTHEMGFLAQAPLGDGCANEFTEILYKPSALANLRDGS
jgi:regulation of enolase protein 1 (concanavalin A-like superfamily)